MRGVEFGVLASVLFECEGLKRQLYILMYNSKSSSISLALICSMSPVCPNNCKNCTISKGTTICSPNSCAAGYGVALDGTCTSKNHRSSNFTSITHSVVEQLNLDWIVFIHSIPQTKIIHLFIYFQMNMNCLKSKIPIFHKLCSFIRTSI